MIVVQDENMGSNNFYAQQNSAKQMQPSFPGRQNIVTIGHCSDSHSDEVKNWLKPGPMLARHDTNNL